MGCRHDECSSHKSSIGGKCIEVQYLNGITVFRVCESGWYQRVFKLAVTRGRRSCSALSPALLH
jgi:hypothetical protein